MLAYLGDEKLRFRRSLNIRLKLPIEPAFSLRTRVFLETNRQLKLLVPRKLSNRTSGEGWLAPAGLTDFVPGVAGG